MSQEILSKFAQLQTENRNQKHEIKRYTQMLMERDEEITKLKKQLDRITVSQNVYTNNLKLAQELGSNIESGQISINHHGLGLVENPFGGVKGSGVGSEMGAEGIEPYLNVKFISQVG